MRRISTYRRRNGWRPVSGRRAASLDKMSQPSTSTMLRMSGANRWTTSATRARCKVAPAGSQSCCHRQSRLKVIPGNQAVVGNAMYTCVQAIRLARTVVAVPRRGRRIVHAIEQPLGVHRPDPQHIAAHQFECKIHHFNTKSIIFNAKSIILNIKFTDSPARRTPWSKSSFLIQLFLSFLMQNSSN